MIPIIVLVAGLMQTNGTIPSVYHGHWTTDLSECGGESTNGVHIRASGVDFYEARGVVRSASVGAKGATATVDFVGEGKSWTESTRFRPIGRNQLELNALGQTIVYRRCPA